VNLTHLKHIPIDYEKAREICMDRGSYLLILYNEKPFTKEIGSLGKREFKKGYYVYVGSAMRGMKNRIRRHLRKNKKRHWHLDYISPACMKTVKLYRIRRKERIEVLLTRRLMNICDDYVPGFGASDTNVDSHFFYFSGRPHRRREFLNLVLDFQMFVI